MYLFLPQKQNEKEMFDKALKGLPLEIEGENLNGLLRVLHEEKPGSTTLASRIRAQLSTKISEHRTHLNNSKIMFITVIVTPYIIPSDTNYSIVHRMQKFLTAVMALNNHEKIQYPYRYVNSVTREMLEVFGKKKESKVEILSDLININSEKNLEPMQLRVAKKAGEMKKFPEVNIKGLLGFIRSDMDSKPLILEINFLFYEYRIGFTPEHDYDFVRRHFEKLCKDSKDPKQMLLLIMVDACAPGITTAARLSTFLLAKKCIARPEHDFQKERQSVLATLDHYGMFSLDPNIDDFITEIFRGNKYSETGK